MKSIFYSLIVLGLITVSGASHAASALRVVRLAGYTSVLNRNLTQTKMPTSRVPASLAPRFNAYKYASLTTAATGKRINNNPLLPKSIETRNFTTFNDIWYGKDQLPNKVKSMISGGKHQWPYYDDPFRLNEWYETKPSDMQKLKIIDYCVQNLNSIKENILMAVIEQDSRAIIAFIPEIPALFKKMKYDSHNTKLTKLLIKLAQDSQAAQVIGREIIENHYKCFWTEDASYTKGDLVRSTIENHPHVHEMSLLAVQHYNSLKHSFLGRLIIATLVKNDPRAIELFSSSIKYTDYLDLECLFLIVREKPDTAERVISLFPEPLKKCFGWIYERKEGQQLTQSQQHARANIISIIEKLIFSYLLDDGAKLLAPEDINTIAEFIYSCHAKEKALAHNGYVIFWHGQPSDQFFPIVLNTFLHSVRLQDTLDNFLLLHTQENPVLSQLKTIDKHRADVDYPALVSAIHQKFNKMQQLERERIITHGRQIDDDRKKMLFLNGSLLGNINSYTSNSFPYYFLTNCNYGHGTFRNTIEDVFEYNGFTCTQQELKDLQKLQEEYINLSKYGTLYLIAIPKENIAKSVVPVFSKGFKNKLAIGDQKVDDMDAIAAELTSSSNRLSATDRKEYAALMTYDSYGLMNPQSGVKIIPNIIANDEQRFKVWQEKWKNLQHRIKERIESEREKAMNEE